MTPTTRTITEILHVELAGIKIPPRPSVMLSIEREMRNPAPNFGTLEEIISLDVGISGSLLKIANSTFFGYNGHARTIKEALQILGLNTVATAIAALSLRKAFAHVPNLERFWDSSARIAQLSGWLVPRLDICRGKLRPDEAFTFGLFRDCGIPVLMSMYADYFEILKAANSEEVRPFTAIEEDEMGLSHATVGAALAVEWQLPQEFQVAIAWHHDRDTILGQSPHAAPEDTARYFMAISQLAEYLFQKLSDMNKTCEWTKLGDACSETLGLQADEAIEALLQAARESELFATPGS